MQAYTQQAVLVLSALGRAPSRDFYLLAKDEKAWTAQLCKEREPVPSLLKHLTCPCTSATTKAPVLDSTAGAAKMGPPAGAVQLSLSDLESSSNSRAMTVP